MTRHVHYAPAAMDLDSAAFYIGVSPRKLGEIQARGDLTPKAQGKKRLFLRADLDAYVESLPDWDDARRSA